MTVVYDAYDVDIILMGISNWAKYMEVSLNTYLGG